MAGTDHHKFTVNVGLNPVTADVSTADESDLWYNTTEGRSKTQVGTGKTSVTGPRGSLPMIYGVADAWYPLNPGGANRSGGTSSTNNRAYAYPLYPGRKCVIEDFAMRILGVAGTGNLRMMLYGSLSTGLPGNLIADYGQRPLSAINTTITGWTVGTDLQPVLYWAVLALQTSGSPPSFQSVDFHDPLVPELGSAPTFGSAESNTVYISDTGFSGTPPASFGTASNFNGGAPLIFVKAAQ